MSTSGRPFFIRPDWQLVIDRGDTSTSGRRDVATAERHLTRALAAFLGAGVESKRVMLIPELGHAPVSVRARWEHRTVPTRTPIRGEHLEHFD